MTPFPAWSFRRILPAVSLAVLFSLASCAARETGRNAGAPAKQETAPDPASPEIRLGIDLIRSIRDGDYGSVSNLTSHVTEEPMLPLLLKRVVCHTSAELIPREASER